MIQARPSHTKFGGIYVASCDASLPLYPLDVDPLHWRSCHDAYEFTWTYDPDRYLTALSDVNKQKLAKSMGYCPHHRCQLGNLTNAQHNSCPVGLCYTKLENAALSFGACCFIDGNFDNGEIIGYEDKCQSTAKPIYKKSRVVLATHSTEENHQNYSYNTFINANMIYPNLIATQCPMKKTIQDVKQMVVQQKINLWIQLTSSKQLFDSNNPKSKDCHLLTSAFENGTGYEELHHIENPSLRLQSSSFVQRKFRLNYRQRSSSDQQIEFVDKSFTDEKKSVTVDHVWFKDWEDFEIPNASYNEVRQHNVQYLVDT